MKRGSVLRAVNSGRLLRWNVRALFFVALPLALLTTNVRFAFSEQRVYQYSIDHYDVPSVAHISRSDLIDATRDIRAYFLNSDDYLRTKVHDQSGNVVPLFNSKEVLHMHDVKSLVRAVYAVEAIALFLVAAYVVGVFVWGQEEGFEALARRALQTCLVTVVLIVAFGVLAATGSFDSLFLRFHELSFGNNYWQLDPARDHLVQMFPEGFWQDATLLIAGMTVLESLIIGAASFVFLRRHAHPAIAAVPPAEKPEAEIDHTPDLPLVSSGR